MCWVSGSPFMQRTRHSDFPGNSREAAGDEGLPANRNPRESHSWRRNLRRQTPWASPAGTFNETCPPPLEESEVVRTANSAWQYTERGQNRFGQHGAFFPVEEVQAMLHDQDAFVLLALPARQPWRLGNVAARLPAQHARKPDADCSTMKSLSIASAIRSLD